MTEGSMPPAERPQTNRQEGEQEHLREDAGLAEGSVADDEQKGHLQEDKGLIDKAKDKLQGQ